MIRKFASALFLFPFFFQAQAQTPKSLLWEISGNGLSSPSFLYGTMHVGDKRVYNFSKAVMPSFQAADAYAMELDPGEADPVAMMEMMKLDSGKLQDMFSESEWQRLDSFMLAKTKTSIMAFNDFSPFFVYSMMAQTMFKNQKGQALDLYFYKEALKAKKEIHGLETVEEQIGAISAMPLEEQRSMLLDAIDKQEGQDMMKDLMKYYVKGDLDKLQELSESSEFSEESETALIVDRNAVMVDRMQPLIAQQSTFIAVGALHLPGDEGILNLLKKKGFTVKPLK